LGTLWRGPRMENVGIVYAHLEYHTAIWYIFMVILYTSPVLVYCVKKNLATLLKFRFILTVNRISSVISSRELKSCFFSFPFQFLFPSSNYSYNYKLQFFYFCCWRLCSSSPEWVGITYVAYSSFHPPSYLLPQVDGCQLEHFRGEISSEKPGDRGTWSCDLQLQLPLAS
jgi:hypothetical protein